MGESVGTTGQPAGRIASLDGIRAIVVVAVMMFHFGQGWIPGGDIGVDVFFVLSGFLITTLLVQQVPKPFELRRFWERLVRRLFPALALMLLIVFLFARALPPLEQTAIRGQGIATVLYNNDWRVLATGSEYFEAYQNPSPLLHMWILSVEEQWYVLLPLILLLLLAMRRFNWRSLMWVTGSLAVASMAWTWFVGWQGAPVDRVYPGTDTRAQQLLVGGLFGVVGLLGLLGLPGLLVMFMAWPEGQWVLVQLPFAALANVMVMGSLDPGSRVNRWLSVTPLRAIGLIRYGPYLWHWPVSGRGYRRRCRARSRCAHSGIGWDRNSLTCPSETMTP
jgi:peptidoglycan/LPS O-acetylase OafA/YrhL